MNSKKMAFLAANATVSLLILAYLLMNSTYWRTYMTSFHIPRGQFVLNIDSQSDETPVTHRLEMVNEGPSEDVDKYACPLQGHTLHSFTIPNDKACAQVPSLLIWVFSAPQNKERRDVVRRTWGRVTMFKPMVSLVFSVAVTHDERVQKSILSESTLYTDIVQDGAFIDDYSNLTYKSLSMLRWSKRFCSAVKLVMKTDDDSFIMPNRLMKWLLRYEEDKQWPSNAILGTVWRNKQPDRNPLSKWYVSIEDWPNKTFAAQACPGSGYFMSGDAIASLLDAVCKVQFLWLEDMYITGALAEKAGLGYYNMKNQHILEYDTYTSYLLKADQKKFLVGHLPSPKSMQDLWTIANAVDSLTELPPDQKPRKSIQMKYT